MEIFVTMCTLFIDAHKEGAPVTRCCLVTHRCTYAPLRCRTSQSCRTFISLSVSLWNILVTSYSMVRGWRVLRAEHCFSIGLSGFPNFCLIFFSLYLISFIVLILWVWGLRTFGYHSLPALYYRPRLEKKKEKNKKS